MLAQLDALVRMFAERRRIPVVVVVTGLPLVAASDVPQEEAVPPPVDVSDPVVYCFDQWRRQAIAREHRWDSHAVTRHPELKGSYAEVEATIRRPDFGNLDATYPDTEVFYRTIEPPHPKAGYYCKVVVRFGPGTRRAPSSAVRW